MQETKPRQATTGKPAGDAAKSQEETTGNRAHATQKPHGVSWRNVPGAPHAGAVSAMYGTTAAVGGTFWVSTGGAIPMKKTSTESSMTGLQCAKRQAALPGSGNCLAAAFFSSRSVCFWVAVWQLFIVHFIGACVKFAILLVARAVVSVPSLQDL